MAEYKAPVWLSALCAGLAACLVLDAARSADFVPPSRSSELSFLNAASYAGDLDGSFGPPLSEWKTRSWVMKPGGWRECKNFDTGKWEGAVWEQSTRTLRRWNGKEWLTLTRYARSVTLVQHKDRHGFAFPCLEVNNDEYYVLPMMLKSGEVFR